MIAQGILPVTVQHRVSDGLSVQANVYAQDNLSYMIDEGCTAEGIVMPILAGFRIFRIIGIAST